MEEPERDPLREEILEDLPFLDDPEFLRDVHLPDEVFDRLAAYYEDRADEILEPEDLRLLEQLASRRRIDGSESEREKSPDVAPSPADERHRKVTEDAGERSKAGRPPPRLWTRWPVLAAAATVLIVAGLWIIIPSSTPDPEPERLDLAAFETGQATIVPPQAFEGQPLVVMNAANVFDWENQPPRAFKNPAGNSSRPRGAGQVYARVSPAIFVVRTRTGFGTGFLVDDNGRVITNQHVVERGTDYDDLGRQKVALYRGVIDKDRVMQIVKQPIPAIVVKMDKALGLVLLQIVPPVPWLENISPIKASKVAPKPAMDCILIGHKGSNLLWSARQGLVKKVARYPRDFIKGDSVQPFILDPDRGQSRGAQLAKAATALPDRQVVRSDCEGEPGDSGGPLLDKSGDLLGVTYVHQAEAGMKSFVYHLQVSEVQNFLRGAPDPGLRVEPVAPDPWRLGVDVELRATRLARRGEFDWLVAGRAEPRAMLVDLDNDTACKRNDAAAIKELITTRSFEAEVAFHFRADRNIAFYDSRNNGVFDLVLVDLDRDGDAEARFRLEAGKWVFERVSEPWIRAAYLAFTRNDEKLRQLAFGKLWELAKQTRP